MGCYEIHTAATQGPGRWRLLHLHIQQSKLLQLHFTEQRTTHTNPILFATLHVQQTGDHLEKHTVLHLRHSRAESVENQVDKTSPARQATLILPLTQHKPRLGRILRGTPNSHHRFHHLITHETSSHLQHQFHMNCPTHDPPSSILQQPWLKECFPLR